jgi:2-polyprenyl-6-methoxyphenol hydroxylase-like FAD-dependent oxidoreductase
MNERVLIVGAGPGGLAATLALRQAGVEAVVFERSPELREVGAGVSLWPNAVKVLRRLGVGETVEANGAFVQDRLIRTWRGESLGPLVAGEIERRYGVPLLVVHRACLQTALRSALDHDAIRTGRDCVAIQQDGAGVSVSFRDGQREQGTIVVGADGLRSTVRALLFDDRTPRYSGLTAWQSVVPLDALLAKGLRTGETWGQGALFGTALLGGNQAYWWASAREREGGGRPADEEKAAVRGRFRGWHAPIADLIDATVADAIDRTPLYERPPLRHWTSGRVTLLGDAAHPMLPNLGQGACQAIEDGAVLADALSRAGDAVAALTDYSERRCRRAAFVARQVHRTSRLAHAQNPLAVGLRDVVIRGRSPGAAFRRVARVVGEQRGDDPGI